jgi:hypothetical protein
LFRGFLVARLWITWEADMDMNYKGHQISSFSRQEPENYRWLVEIDILWPEAGGDRNQRIEGPLAGFTSQAAAESWGIQIAKEWIDDGKPS